MPTLTCPAGHRFKIPKVIYGYPSDETWAAEERGEVTIGGCLPDLPVERACPRCGLTTQWASEWASSGPEEVNTPKAERLIRT